MILRRLLPFLGLIYHVDYIVNFRLYSALSPHGFLGPVVAAILHTVCFFSLATAVWIPKRRVFAVGFTCLMLLTMRNTHFSFGGDVILLNLMLALSLIHQTKEDTWSEIGRWILFVQTSTMYFYTALSKALDTDWTSGRTFQAILNYSEIEIPQIVRSTLAFFSFVVIAVQFSGLLIFNRKLKPAALLLLSLVHIGMVVILPFFSVFCLINLWLIHLTKIPALNFFYRNSGAENSPLSRATPE